MKEYRRPTSSELAQLHQLNLRGAPAVVSRMVVARVLAERDQLVFVARAARYALEAIEDGDGINKALHVLTNALQTWEAESTRTPRPNVAE